MFNYKKNIFISFAVLTMLLVVTAITTFFIDPLQHYRKATFYQAYPLQQRYLVWGLLDNYKYDTVLVGTSMSENFIKKNIDEELNTDVLKASISGATAYEENLVISHAINNGVKKVVYVLDLFSFKGDIKKFGYRDLPLYIENDTYLDDYKYLLNIDIVFRDTSKIFLTNFMGIKKEKLDINRFWNWSNEKEFSTIICQENYKKFIDTNNAYYADEFYIKKLINSFDFNILPHIKNQDIEYIMIFPPYSILTYKLFQHYNKLEEFIEFKKYIVENIGAFNNVKIYDFQIANKITHNLSYYKDISHYSEEINKWMIRQVKDNNYLVTKDNIDKHLIELRDQVQSYDLNKTIK